MTKEQWAEYLAVLANEKICISCWAELLEPYLIRSLFGISQGETIMSRTFPVTFLESLKDLSPFTSLSDFKPGDQKGLREEPGHGSSVLFNMKGKSRCPNGLETLASLCIFPNPSGIKPNLPHR